VTVVAPVLAGLTSVVNILAPGDLAPIVKVEVVTEAVALTRVSKIGGDLTPVMAATTVEVPIFTGVAKIVEDLMPCVSVSNLRARGFEGVWKIVVSALVSSESDEQVLRPKREKWRCVPASVSFSS